MQILILLLVLGLFVMTGCNALLPRTVGSPFGHSVRAGHHIATLIVTEEPSIPSLHHNPENDRFRMGLLLHPVNGGAPRPLIPLASSMRHSDFRNAAKVLGFDGKLIWFMVTDIGAYDVESGRVLTVEHLRRANRHLDDLWQNARYDIGRRLQVTSHDYKQRYEIDPSTLRAVPVSSGRRPPSMQEVRDLMAGGRSEQYRTPGRVRATAASDPLRLTGPDGFLMAHRTEPGLQGTIVISRVDAADKPLWSTNSGIADLDQILPGEDYAAFIGKRPRVPNKVQEPVLAIVNNATGVMTVHALWQR
ncbi:MAG: hypothetical protein U0R19_08440 [Bryobacteraceae bacterium]